MGPPKQTIAKKKRSTKEVTPFNSLPPQHHLIQMQNDQLFNSQPPLIENKEEYETDSDSAYGFGNGWSNP